MINLFCSHDNQTLRKSLTVRERKRNEERSPPSFESAGQSGGSSGGCFEGCCCCCCSLCMLYLCVCFGFLMSRPSPHLQLRFIDLRQSEQPSLGHVNSSLNVTNHLSEISCSLLPPCSFYLPTFACARPALA